MTSAFLECGQAEKIGWGGSIPRSHTPLEAGRDICGAG